MSEIEKRITRNLKLLEMTNAWVNNADNKTGVICAIFSLIYGGLTAIWEQTKLLDGNILLFTTLLSAVGVVTMMTSIIIYALAIVPSLISKQTRVTNASLFYGDIAQCSLKKFQIYESKLDDEEFNTELISEIHINSRICFAKMRKLRIGILFSVLAIVCTFINLLCTLFFV